MDDNQNDSYSMQNPAFISAIRLLQKDIIESEVSNIVCNVQHTDKRLELLKKIEKLILKMVRGISTNIEPKLKIPIRHSWDDCTYTNRLSLKSKQNLNHQEVTYTRSTKRMSILFSLLAKVYRLLQCQSSATYRELYYQHTNLYGSQNAVKLAILDICQLLKASPWDLRVFSSSKGLVAGPLLITLSDKQVINCSAQGGVLVPQDVKGIHKVKSPAKFILLVEKDAAFQKLLDEGALTRLGPCIIITGKGEPDMNTRLLLHRLWQNLRIPILALVDANPYGIEIMCTYRFGSLSLSQHSEHLAVSSIRWLGIHPTDIEALSIPSIPLTPRDITKLLDLAGRPYMQQDPNLMEQINCMLSSGVKCEIENLTALSTNFLTDMFLSVKVVSKEVI